MTMSLRWTKTAALTMALALVATQASAQSDDARQVLDHYRALKPNEDDLAMYRLDWVSSLETAKRRAAEEKRPILVIAVHARYGDLFTGHC